MELLVGIEPPNRITSAGSSQKTTSSKGRVVINHRSHTFELAVAVATTTGRYNGPLSYFLHRAPTRSRTGTV